MTRQLKLLEVDKETAIAVALLLREKRQIRKVLMYLRGKECVDSSQLLEEAMNIVLNSKKESKK